MKYLGWVLLAGLVLGVFSREDVVDVGRGSAEMIFRALGPIEYEMKQIDRAEPGYADEIWERRDR